MTASQTLRAEAANVRFIDPADLSAIEAERWSLVIEGLYGIGLARAIDGAPSQAEFSL